MTDVAEPRRGAATHQRIRDAGVLILADYSAGEPRILLGRRNAGVAFLPGTFVFPGGRVDRADYHAHAHGVLDPQSVRRLSVQVARPSAGRARALALAAIREMAEEAGLFVGTAAAAPAARAPAPIWQPFASRGLAPNLSALRFVARAITPPGAPRRFDTRFFLADVRAVVDRVEGVAGPDAELIELVWATLPEAVELQVPLITRLVLAELAALLAAPDPEAAAVPFYREERGPGRRILLP